MIQATPFDLALFGADIDLGGVERDVRLERAVKWFIWCRNKVYDTNNRFAKNPALSGIRLRVPMTEQLFIQLLEIPPWPNKRQQGGPIQTLKVAVLAFINARHARLEDRPILILENDTQCSYQIVQPNSFFPEIIHPYLQAFWSEAVGICAYKRCTEIITNTLIISPGRQHNADCLSITSEDIYQPELPMEIIDIPMMVTNNQWPEEGEPDIWLWEVHVRRTLWGDVRLPFSGPSGLFGFRPHIDHHWQPGHILTTREIDGRFGYLDTFGGLWQWEGGRARNNTPFDGHWNVQLTNKDASHLWCNHIQEIIERRVRLHSNHVNIEVDGRITDITFDFI